MPRRGDLGDAVPGNSCQATIAPSLRDNSQQAFVRCFCEMSASASRRDDTDRSLARSAWESVPPKSRPVGHGMIGYQDDNEEDWNMTLNRYSCLAAIALSLRDETIRPSKRLAIMLALMVETPGLP